MRKLSVTFLALFAFSGCVSMATKPERQFSRKPKKNALVSLWLPFTGKRAAHAYSHSLNGFPKSRSDCNPNCPKVDIWQYKYRPKSETLVDQKPIASRKEHWKAKSEARIIAISMFNGNELYVKGLFDYVESFKLLKKVNKVKQDNWGYETFTIRVYVAKRNPAKRKELGDLKNDTPDEQIERFLDAGFEVAFVDNGLSKTTKGGTFWRFMVAAEEMPQGQRIRYLIRDADSMLTAGEVFSVGEWMNSGLDFHRMHIIPVCFGPLTAMSFGGSHEGKGPFSDLKNRIEYFPYRSIYGDDELFTRDMMWPIMKDVGSVITHHYPRGMVFDIANPYRGSCEEPTQLYCDEIRPGGICKDVLMPNEIQSPLIALGLRGSIEELKSEPAYFDLAAHTERGKLVIKALSGS